jgi:hypothetical protein
MEAVHDLQIAAEAIDPDAVRAFCLRHGSLVDLQAALRLIATIFPPRKSLTVKTSSDPESDAEWLLIEMIVEATPDEALDCYRRYVKELVRSIPPERRANVRLAYGVSGP